MDGFEILIPLAPFLMVVAIVVIPAWLKSRERREMQATLRTAIEKGQPLPPEVIETISKENVKPPATAARDLRTGVILLAVAFGIGIFGYAVSFAEMDAYYPIVGIAAIPGMIGLAFIILSFFNKNKG
ncbi:hypothetical protein EJ082_15875 [Brevundimonas diminuta]|jgi:hypothetical protein|uniref:DUF6249 domain-containing protein n=1 Tax=Brevundimonas diminuta TaxID=293 RepID=A0A2X1AGL0_BREDI|nr:MULTISPECIES: DUF6249 domain-containing protein [Brevundimonas]MBD3574446.1 hypothetical protein [Brevundimonas diminuta]MBD3819368.1 hypothetical protein [Brevundimonas diminuta]OMG60965.1 hypothetical protein BJP32_02860 [Brevundimonas sp. ZS04]QAT15493.1 hypothetical protein EQG53_14710 [Brevundimonas diminuta]QQB90291.1 hypothetical protein I6H83_07740 [Brevundimonas diminuta]